MALPEARQCAIDGHPDFGAVAVHVEPEPGVVLWGIFHPMSSGRWGTDDDVWNWTHLAPTDQPDDEPVIDPTEGE